MTLHLGYVTAGTTLYIPFHTFDSNGASITLTGLAVTDIEIYKNGSTTQRSSDAGYALLDTDGIDFDGLTGIHGFSIDLADNADAGFYAAGSSYWVVVSAVTVDTRTVSFVAATFFIGPVAANVTQLLGTAWLTPGTAGTPDVNTKLAGGTAWGSGAITAAAIADGAIDAATFAAGAIDAAAIAANAIGASELAADAVAEIADAVWDEASTGHTDAGKAGEQLWTDVDAILVDTGTTLDDLIDTEVAAIITTLGTPAGASIAADIAAIEAQTDDIGAAGAGLTALPWNAAWDAEVQSEVDDALVAQNLDHLVKIAVDTNFATTVHLDSVVGHLADGGTTATFDRTTDSLEALQAEHDATQTKVDTVDDLLDTEIAAIVSTLGSPAGASISADIAAIEAQTDDIGAAGAGLTAVPWNAAWDAEVQSEVQDALDGTVADSVPADGTRPSISSGIYMITQFLLEKAVSGTTVTVKKPDGSTSLFTLTLDSGTDPTSVTRAS